MYITKNLENITVFDNVKINKALNILNDGGAQVLLVINEFDKFQGIITDGDVRRYILKDGNLNSQISEIMNKDFRYSSSFNESILQEIFNENNINHIPIIDEEKRLIGLALKSKPNNNERINEKISVVVMAGGKGSRLAPLTNIIPKPLIPIGFSTISEKIFETFYSQNFNDFKLVINFKKELIKSYFNELDHDYSIEFFEEEKFLGTIGGIKEFSNNLTDNFFLTNCDVVSDTNYSQFLEDHIREDAYLSILGLKKTSKVPYGVLELDNKSNVKGLIEKPSQTYTIMTGIYILNKKVLDYIPKNKEFGMDELIKTLINERKKVYSHVIEDGWYDMGQFSEYKKLLLHLDN